jgi:hypothetical protein
VFDRPHDASTCVHQLPLSESAPSMIETDASWWSRMQDAVSSYMHNSVQES